MAHGSAHRRQLILGLSLGTIGFVLPLLTRNPDFSAGLYLVAASLVTFELVDLCARIWLGMSSGRNGAAHGPTGDRPERVSRAYPFAIVMSVHDIQRDAKRILAPFEPYKNRVWIVDDGSSDETAAYLEFMGWRCMPAELNQKKPGAIKLLLSRLPRDVGTVVVVDPDCELTPSRDLDLGDLDRAVARFQRSGAAACCPRISIQEDGPFTSFQSLECELAFKLGRKGMTPFTITSGVSIYDRWLLEQVLSEHTLSVYAEDLENTLIILHKGHQIHYDDRLIVETEGKPSMTAWFSQRVGWSYGLLRVYAQRWRSVIAAARLSPWSFYNLAVYLGVLGIILIPLRIAGTALLAVSFANSIDALLSLDVIPDKRITDPRFFAATYLAYTLMLACLIPYLRPRCGVVNTLFAVAFYLFYAMAQTAATAVGYLNWVSVQIAGRRMYRDHYVSDESRDPGPLALHRAPEQRK